jgi:hypothetical protein
MVTTIIITLFAVVVLICGGMTLLMIRAAKRYEVEKSRMPPQSAQIQNMDIEVGKPFFGINIYERFSRLQYNLSVLGDILVFLFGAALLAVGWFWIGCLVMLAAIIGILLLMGLLTCPKCGGSPAYMRFLLYGILAPLLVSRCPTCGRSLF